MDTKDLAIQAAGALEELIQRSHLEKGAIVVIGMSTSEITGEHIGKQPQPRLGEELFRSLQAVAGKYQVHLACQCCEHLNRALVIEYEAAHREDIVTVVPQPTAGGSFASAAYRAMNHPVVVEKVQADAGLDIGQTLIGMHCHPVVVPVRLSIRRIGEAVVTACRTRPKYIGGPRAVYETAEA